MNSPPLCRLAPNPRQICSITGRVFPNQSKSRGFLPSEIENTLQLRSIRREQISIYYYFT